MRRAAVILAAIALSCALSCAAWGQQKPDRVTYRVVLHVTELDSAGKSTTRDFMLLTSTNTRGMLNSGDRVPVHSGGAESQYSYTPVGLNVSCTLSDSSRPGTVSMALHVEIAAVAVATPFEPTIHQAVADVNAQVALGTNTQLADFGDMETGAHYTIAAEVTPVTP